MQYKKMDAYFEQPSAARDDEKNGDHYAKCDAERRWRANILSLNI